MYEEIGVWEFLFTDFTTLSCNALGRAESVEIFTLQILPECVYGNEVNSTFSYELAFIEIYKSILSKRYLNSTGRSTHQHTTL